MNDIEKIQEYIPTIYVNDSEPDLDETNLNKTEQALKRVTDAANNAIDALKQLEKEKLSLAAISNVLSDANDKVPSLALANSMQKEIDKTNSNLGNPIVRGSTYSDATPPIAAKKEGTDSGFCPLFSIPTQNGNWSMGTSYGSDMLVMSYKPDGSNDTYQAALRKTANGSGNILTDADLITGSSIKRIRVALEGDRLLFWAYTDDVMMNGYRVDFNGADKRIYYAKITNGATNNFGGATLT